RAALLCVTAREEEMTDASVALRTVQEVCREPHVVPLSLAPLSRSDIARLVQALTRTGSDAEAATRLVEQVWAVSEGNPFVAVETTRAFQEGTVLPEAGNLPMPERVRDLIACRIEPLGRSARELAAVAAVIGREFEFALLQGASGLDEHA